MTVLKDKSRFIARRDLKVYKVLEIDEKDRCYKTPHMNFPVKLGERLIPREK